VLAMHMTSFAGSFSDFELAPLVDLLCGLRKTGDLLVRGGQWVGQLSVEDGRIRGAVAEDEHGLPALDFICTAMVCGQFELEFWEGTPHVAADPQLSEQLSDGLHSRVADLARRDADQRLFAVPSPTAIPRLVAPQDNDDTRLSFSRTTLHVLLAIDGVHNVRDLAKRYGLLNTVKSLAQLSRCGLVVVDEPAPAPNVAPPSPGGGTLSQRVRALGARARRLHAVKVGGELAQAVVVTGALIFGLHTVVQNFRVEGVSMQPNLNGGEALVVDRVAYFHVEHSPLASVLPTTAQGTTRYIFGGPKRGDVAVFKAPPEPGADYIKRIIGLPGESVLVRNGQVFVGGVRLDEPYVHFEATYTFPSDGLPLVIPDAAYFVLGDNRPESFDSHLGWLVSVEDLIGRAWFRYWPPTELGMFSGPVLGS
jgi:signal peptidase I